METPLNSTSSNSSFTPREVVAQIAEARTDAIANGIKVALIGLAAGVAASLTVARRSTAPVFLGLGFGGGMGYAQSRRSLQDFYASNPVVASSACPAMQSLPKSKPN